MRILLLHDDIYLPSFGGGTKVNRSLVEALARRGHTCLVIAHALTLSSDGPPTLAEFHATMRLRGIQVWTPLPHVYRYCHHGVEVDALVDELTADTQTYVRHRSEEFDPDWMVVTEDKRGFLLRTAMETRPDRVVLLLQTVTNLPFGPLTIRPSVRQASFMNGARAVVVYSRFLQTYIEKHSALRPRLVPLPVFGDGPFASLGQFDRGYVTMVNPCDLKGLPLFLGLAKAMPNVAFAVVPTWGADDDVLRRLSSATNVTILPPTDNVEDILRQTRLLLAPSLWPETFGLVVVEAMLRGIPVLASDVGGLPEAKLSVDYVLPVCPAEWRGGAWWFPPQDLQPWASTLAKVLGERHEYKRLSEESRNAAMAYVSRIDIGQFEAILGDLAHQEGSAGLPPTVTQAHV